MPSTCEVIIDHGHAVDNSKLINLAVSCVSGLCFGRLISTFQHYETKCVLHLISDKNQNLLKSDLNSPGREKKITPLNLQEYLLVELATH